MIDNGYAEKWKNEGKEGRCWYLIHGVYHPQNSGKIRVVLDCSAYYANMSVNEELMLRPDLANQIVAVLLRIRKEHVHLWQTSNQRFTRFWYLHTKEVFFAICDRKKRNLSKKVVDYQICTYIFGVT